MALRVLALSLSIFLNTKGFAKERNPAVGIVLVEPNRIVGKWDGFRVQLWKSPLLFLLI
jgi:pyrimidine deaminase RibD-like protein